MANNDTDVNVDIGATGSYKSILSTAIGDFSNFWKSAAGGSGATNAASNMESLSAKLGMSNKAMLGVGVASAVVAAGVVDIGVKSIKAATNYQELTTQLVTGAGESEKNLSMVRQGILQVSDATGESATAAANGLYLIESAGYHGKAGLDVLKIAAEGAKVGNADLQTTANALTTVMHDYGISTNNSGQAMNFLVSTVANGKMHMDDLTGSLGKILPTASQLHVPLAQIGGAMSALTSAGVPASRAAIALNMTMLKLVSPSASAVKALKEVGLSSTDLGTTLTTKGVMPALQQMTDAVGKKFPIGSAQYLNAISTISGGVRGLTGVLGTTGKNMQTFIDNTDKISAATKKAGNTVIGWNLVQKDEKTKMDEAKQSMNNAKIAIGEGLLPVVTAITKAIVNIVKPIAEWIAGHQKLAALILGAIGIFATLVVSILVISKTIGIVKMAWMALNSTFLMSPIGLIIAVIVVAIVLLATHFKLVEKVAGEVFKFIGGVISDVWNWIKGHWPLLLAILTGPFGLAVLFIIDHWNQITAFFSRLPGTIMHAIGGLGSLLVGAGEDLINGLIKGVGNMAGRAVNAVKGIGKDIVSGIKSVLKIFSPSAVFADIGGNIGAGLIQGITGTQAAVIQASASLGHASIAGVQAVPNLNTQGIATGGSVVNHNNTGNTANSQSVTIQNLTIQAPNNSTFQTIMKSINQDTLNASKGLTVGGGAI